VTAATTREEQIERFVQLDALSMVIANLGGVLEKTLPTVNTDDDISFGVDLGVELWPTDDDYLTVESQDARRRSSLKAALICFALADNADYLRGEGERLVANEERILAEGKAVI